MTLAKSFWQCVLTRGDAPALITPVDGHLHRLTWKRLGTIVESWVHWFQREDIGPQQHIATQLANGVDWIAIDLACQTLGIVHVAIDPREPGIRARAIAQQSDAMLTIDQPRYPERATSQIATRNSADLLASAKLVPIHSPAQILTTSGTSGSPKLVVLSHANLMSNAAAKLDAAPQFSSDLRLNILPFAHAYARTCELSTWILSQSQLAITSSWDDWLEQSQRLRPTLANFVPYLAEQAARRLGESSQALGGNLRLLQVGGAGLSEELWNELNERGLPALQGYGLTEASPVVCSNRAGSQRSGTIGPPVAGVSISVDSEGVLWTSGPHVMLGYLRDESASRQAIRDGWLCTGDLVEQTAAGLRVVGRKSEQIVLSTGYKVAPSEIETRLLRHPWIEQVVVTGSNQPFVTARLWPSLKHIPPTFFVTAPESYANLDRERLLSQLAETTAELFHDLPPHAKPRFALLAEPLSMEAGTLGRKGTPQRALFDL